MFEKIVLRRATGGEPVSAGQLAEALLYYQNVHIVIDHGSFHLLVKQIGIQNLLGLLRRPNVSAVYCEESVATHTESIGAFQIHSYIAFSITGHEKVGGHLETRQQRFEYFLQELGYERKQASRFARTFLERVPIRRLTGDHYLKGGVTHAGKADLSDAVYVQAALGVNNQRLSHFKEKSYETYFVRRRMHFRHYRRIRCRDHGVHEHSGEARGWRSRRGCSDR